MPGIINSAPDCVTHAAGSEAARVKDTADFILQGDYKDCAGFMTFGPGSTYGDGGTGAADLYMILTWLGIVVMLAVLVGWVIYENRRLIQAVTGFGRADSPMGGPPPQPGGVGDSR
jgi:TM2 domain-containing membrane protein YozV